FKQFTNSGESGCRPRFPIAHGALGQILREARPDAVTNSLTRLLDHRDDVASNPDAVSTFSEHMKVAGAKNRPPMLDKSMYNSWQSRVLLYIKGKKNGKMKLESIKNGPLVYPTIKENGQIRKKKYTELTEHEKLQDDYDVQATNIILQGLSPDVYSLVNHHQAAKVLALKYVD
ncbi:hypothetical protein Tco_0901195, partial [Tanacetum coccineum]